MQQIPYRYYDQFLPERSDDERERLYAITGGVPKYIEQIYNSADCFDAIEKEIINENSFLYYEPEFLLEKEVAEVGSYFSILRVIALGATKLSEIASRLETKQSGLSKYLRTLTELDLLEREVPVTEENPNKSKMGQYKIKDNYIKFWFAFIYPNRALIESGRRNFVLTRIKQHFVENHMSYVYECICRERMWDMEEMLLPFDRVGRWWNKNTEIDIVAYDSAGDSMIFGECKYSLQPKGTRVLEELKRKSKVVNWKNEKRKEMFVLFSKSGYTDELKTYADGRDDVVLV